jgi:hypothetical protein
MELETSSLKLQSADELHEDDDETGDAIDSLYDLGCAEFDDDEYTDDAASWQTLATWREWAADFGRYRALLPEQVKTMIRQGIPDILRGAVWIKLTSSRESSTSALRRYAELRLMENAPCEAEIVRDINRTFPNHVMYRDKHAFGQDSLLSVLRAYSVFNPEVGYCQGMGFICGLLLMYMDEEDAFLMLVTLLEDYGMAGLFRPGLPLLNKYFFQLRRLISEHLPRLSRHLQEQGVEPTMYASQWFMTVCIYKFPFESVCRIWDIFLSEGVKIVFRVALAILKINEEALLRESFEGVLNIVKLGPSRIETNKLIDCALSIKLKNERLTDLSEEYASRPEDDENVD